MMTLATELETSQKSDIHQVMALNCFKLIHVDRKLFLYNADSGIAEGGIRSGCSHRSRVSCIS